MNMCINKNESIHNILNTTSSNDGLKIKKSIIGIKENIQKDQKTIIGIKKNTPRNLYPNQPLRTTSPPSFLPSLLPSPRIVFWS